MPTLMFVAVAVALVGGPGEEPGALPPLNRKVVEFARANLGKPVGDGVCVTLAVDALREAGAARGSLRDPKGDYTWGEPVADFKDVLPGDILQFRDAVFHGKRALAGGGTMSWHQEYRHHTAIVAKVERGGKLITVYHQNVAVKGKPESDKVNVKEAELRMDSLKKGGWIRAYRPTTPDRPPVRKPFDGRLDQGIEGEPPVVGGPGHGPRRGQGLRGPRQARDPRDQGVDGVGVLAHELPAPVPVAAIQQAEFLVMPDEDTSRKIDMPGPMRKGGGGAWKSRDAGIHRHDHRPGGAMRRRDRSSLAC